MDLCLHIMILIRNDIMLRVRYVHDTDMYILMFQILVVIHYMILIILS